MRSKKKHTHTHIDLVYVVAHQFMREHGSEADISSARNREAKRTEMGLR